MTGKADLATEFHYRLSSIAHRIEAMLQDPTLPPDVRRELEQIAVHQPEPTSPTTTGRDRKIDE
jgi:hypothetical protein